MCMVKIKEIAGGRIIGIIQEKKPVKPATVQQEPKK